MTVAQIPYMQNRFWIAVDTDSRADYGLAGKDSRNALSLSLLAQDLLSCLAPFASVIATGARGGNLFSQYIERLKQEPEIACLPLDSLGQIFLQAINRRLLLPHPEVFGFFYIHPVFSDFLRTFRNSSGREEVCRAVERAFVEHYTELGAYMAELAFSDQPRKRRLGHRIIRLEYENLITAMKTALDAKKSVLSICAAIFAHPNIARQSAEIGKTVSEKLAAYSQEELSGNTGADFILIMNRIAALQTELGQYENAENSFRTVLSLLENLSLLDEGQKARLKVPILRSLGKAAAKQRLWPRAEAYLREALNIGREFNSRYEQSLIGCKLGIAAMEQRHWKDARDSFLESLEIFIIRNDHYAQCMVLKNLFRVWEGSGEDEDIPKSAARILGWSTECVEKLFREQGKEFRT